MCGIVGIFNYKTNRPVDPSKLSAANDCLYHRGPDDSGLIVDDSLGLAMRRLSIIDIQHGRQPVHNEDKSIWSVYNGEIFNYAELIDELTSRGHTFNSNSDSETIPHLYEEYSEDFIHKLNGMYALALWDKPKKKLILCRDPAGIKPLYLSETDDGIIFASEIKAILKLINTPIEDPLAINCYLNLGYIPSPLSGLKEIKKCQAGTVHIFTDTHTIKNNGIESFIRKNPLSNENDFFDVFEQSLKRNLVSDAPLGLLLSGGIDSSLIAAVCAKKTTIRPTCYTLKFLNASFDESPFAIQTAQRLGLEAKIFPLESYEVKKNIEAILENIDEPLMDYSCIPTYFITMFARKEVKVLLSGDGGDELFGGYPTHYLPLIAETFTKIPRLFQTVLKKFINSLPVSSSYMSIEYKLKRFINGISQDLVKSHIGWKRLFDYADLSTSLDIFNNYRDEAAKWGLSKEEQMMHLDFRTFLQDDCLQKSDRMGMANNIEIRVPFLDKEMIRFAYGLSRNKKVGLFKTKKILRSSLQKILPGNLTSRKKQGFTPPMAEWIKGELKEFIYDTLNSPFNQEDKKMWEKLLIDHIEGKSENSRQIWALVVLAQWRRNFQKVRIKST